MIYFHVITNKFFRGMNYESTKEISKYRIGSIIKVRCPFTSSVALASNDNIGYIFTLKDNYGNNYSGERYRQTENKHNEWKVNMTYSF